MCQGYYDIFECPKVQVICNPHISFTYIPSHLHHILFELIKNSLRATVEFHGVNASKYPPIKIIVAEGHEVCPFFYPIRFSFRTIAGPDNQSER